MKERRILWRERRKQESEESRLREQQGLSCPATPKNSSSEEEEEESDGGRASPERWNPPPPSLIAAEVVEEQAPAAGRSVGVGVRVTRLVQVG
jgi:hypothetical protein